MAGRPRAPASTPHSNNAAAEHTPARNYTTASNYTAANTNTNSNVARMDQSQTPHSLSLAPASIPTALDGMVSVMSPLTIGMGGLTEQQAAEVVELLTPFMSPTGTPAFGARTMQSAYLSHPATPLALGQQAMSDAAVAHQLQQIHHHHQFSPAALGSYAPRADDGRVFSPLTSPALVPQPASSVATAAAAAAAAMASSEAYMAQQQQQQQQHQLSLLPQQRSNAAGPVSMPPPSPSITVEHIIRRQQLMLDKQAATSPLFPPYSPHLAAAAAAAGATGGGGSSKARRSSSLVAASPHHHPYRIAGQSTAGKRAAQQTTPLLPMAVPQQPTEGLAGLSLPDSMAAVLSTANDARGRTLHQLNASPQLGGWQGPTSQPQTVEQQIDTWLGLGSGAAITATTAAATTAATAASATTPITATPASLLNLPVSAHHLPHSSTGDIVTPDAQSLAANPGSNGTLLRTALPTNNAPKGLPAAPPSNFPSLVTQSAPMGELVRPPAPPPLHIGPASSSTTTAAAADRTRAAPRGRRAAEGSGRGRRRSRASVLLSPRATPLVPSILKDTASPTPSPAMAPMKTSIAPRRSLQPTGSTPATPRQRPIVAATSTTNIVGLEADVVTRLATKSNYQNILEGNSEFLGLKYRGEFKTGLERRRTNHKQAEQKRRDSLKLCFEDLKGRLTGLDPKLISKIYLLRKANAFIDSLKRTNEALARAAREHGVDVDAILAKEEALDDEQMVEPSEEMQEEEEEEEEDDG
ncbi:hypothetical protein GGI07_002845 [Coemansia sp. Benny D115]|nr:hypothetical protein GGI07_002845 [Coemansia sp. Benny D115]